MARVAVDVVVGRIGIKLLRAAGHDVVVEAERCEPDLKWFTRAKLAGAEFVISADKDLSILCYDNRVEFFRVRVGHSGRVTAERFIQWHQARERRLRASKRPA